MVLSLVTSSVFGTLGAMIADASTDPIPAIGYGALGSLFIAAITGLVWFKPSVLREQDRTTKAETQVDRLLAINEKLAEGIKGNNDVLTAMKPVLEENVVVLSDIRAQRAEQGRAPNARRRAP